LSPAEHQHDVVRLQHGLGRRLAEARAAPDLIDGHHAVDAVLEGADGAAGDRPDAEAARDDLGHAVLLAGVVLGPEVAGQRCRGLADIDPEQQRADLRDDDDDGDEAEQIGDAVGGRHVGLKPLDLARRQSEPRDRLGRRAQHGGFRRRAGEQPRGRAVVEPEQRDGRRQQQQHGGDLDEGQDAVAPAAANIVEELRAGREAEREDEEREGDVLQVRADLHAELPDRQRDEQRSANTADLDGADPDLADQIAQGQ